MAVQLSVVPDMGEMTPGETRHLQALERRVAAGLQSFREVGEALLEIRDKRLFRMTHTSFEVYCSERWGIERSRAYQLMGAAQVYEALPEGDRKFIVNEVQARELLPVFHADPKLLPTIMRQVESATVPLTAPRLRTIVRNVTGNGNGHVVEDRNLTTSVVALLQRVTVEYEKWLRGSPKPNRAEKALVKEHAERLVRLLSG
jgi:hypothetical protein